MSEESNFVLIGDERDIPMSLGLIIMVWNACELSMRGLIRTLGSRGQYQHYHAVEALVSELGSVGLTQALNCYSHEFPDDEAEIAAAIAHAAQAIEICRAYRNYYVHQISGVTRYGIDLSYDVIENDTPIHEAMMVGPFAKIYSKTAKGKMKFAMAFIKPNELIDFNNYLASLHEYLDQLQTSVIHYFRSDLTFGERASPPQPLPLLSALKKQVSDHPKLKLRPALAPWLPVPDEEEEPTTE